MAQLNQVYAKMLNAMTVNMYAAAPMAAPAAPAPEQPAAPGAEA